MKESIINKRTVVIVIDGFHHGLLKFFPYLKKISNRYASSILMSVPPYTTASAWASILTGKDPGEHGVLSFVYYDKDFNIQIFDGSDIEEEFFYQELDKRGYNLFLMAIPFSDPSRTKKGDYIFSWFSRHLKNKIIYPPELEEKYKSFKDLQIEHPSDRDFSDNASLIKAYHQIFKNQKEAFLEVLKDTNHQFLMFFITCSDFFQHRFFNKINENNLEGSEGQKLFKAIDDFIQTLDGELDYSKDNLVIMSDHGFGTFPKTLAVNTWLYKNGYLKLGGEKSFSISTGGAEDLLQRREENRYLNFGKTSRLFFILSKFTRFLSPFKKLIKKILGISSLGYRVDLLRSTAYSFLAYDGGVYINKEGPKKEEKKVRQEILKKLNLIKGIQAKKKEDVFVKGKKFSVLPDIIVQSEQFILTNEIGGKIFKEIDRGFHQPQGFICIKGADFRRKVRFQSPPNLLDIAPTILNLFAIPKPKDMNGRVLKEVFREDFVTY